MQISIYNYWLEMLSQESSATWLRLYNSVCFWVENTVFLQLLSVKHPVRILSLVTSTFFHMTNRNLVFFGNQWLLVRMEKVVTADSVWPDHLIVVYQLLWSEWLTAHREFIQNKLVHWVLEIPLIVIAIPDTLVSGICWFPLPFADKYKK